MGKGMRGGDCGERDEGRGLWGKGCRKWMRGGNRAERDEGTVRKGTLLSVNKKWAVEPVRVKENLASPVDRLFACLLV